MIYLVYIPHYIGLLSGDKATHSRPLVGVNPLLPGNEELDAAYAELEEAGLVETVNDAAAFVPLDGSQVEFKTLYRCTTLGVAAG